MPDLENVDQSDSDPEYQAAAHILYEGETGEDRLATVQRVIEEYLIDSKIQPPQSHQIGDVLGICAHAVLELSPLYPGDELVPFGDERRVRKRFKLMRVSDHDYTVEDAYFNEFTILPRRAEFFKMKNWVTRPLHRVAIGESIVNGMSQYFEEISTEIPEFSEYVIKRILLEREGDNAPEIFLFSRPDGMGMKHIMIPGELLENPQLDFVGWLHKHDLREMLEQNELDKGFDHDTEFSYFYSVTEDNIHPEEFVLLKDLRAADRTSPHTVIRADAGTLI
ncbi:hypothetical protein B0H10DRAFT_1952292 [Mycena sp. CBHHK59/15]|nr:hypothetical protein B0H10DRAFT_1952292 [Mycena sp. CBHHK59/15]